MSVMGLTIENGRPVVIVPLPGEAFMAFLVMGFDKRTGDPIMVPMYRTTFMVEGKPFAAFEACMN
jgi:hypothetical protein